MLKLISVSYIEKFLDLNKITPNIQDESQLCQSNFRHAFGIDLLYMKITEITIASQSKVIYLY